MKRLEKLKISHLVQSELNKHELKNLVGGEYYCSCDSSIAYNSLANYRGGYHHIGESDKYWDYYGNPVNP